LQPRNPIGTKKLKKKMKNTEAYWAGWLLLGKLLVIASAIMHMDIPNPLKMKSLRRPKRSMVKKATKELRNFQVKQPPERIRAVWWSKPRPCSKMVVE
jgi:hypothetical protein